ncbi:MAG: extracellular solute-binding protein [Xylanivirga thermophila]|jgi:multiple sugar transport system substrate-binding protein|uniref:extracellular solute-binding protein n=1 Tax=Xylanivirga thermophila TaxID=2496273 RepID=UPI00101D5DF7|nr:extracellular solute-binding protein [Xylanivirga thermophila]
MKKSRRIFTVLLIVVMLISLVACSSDKDKESGGQSSGDANGEISGKVRVSLAGWQLEDGIDPFTGKKTVGLNNYMKDTFKKQYPKIKTEISIVPWENAKAKQQALLMSKDVDIIYTGGAFASQFNEQGLLRSIDDLLDNDPDFKPEDIYLEGLWNNSYSTRSLDMKNRIGLPAILGQRMVMYDKKIFDDWGVEYLSEHPTPEEIIEKAKKMTGKNPKTGEPNYGLWWSGNSLNGSTFIALTFYYNALGAEGALNDLKKLQWKLNDKEMVDVFEWLKDASTLPPPSFVNGQGMENFGRENNNIAIALDNNGGTIIGDYKANKKTDMLERYEATVNLGPNGEGWVAVDPIIMAKEPKDVEAAWEVMKFLASPETQKWNYENFGTAPTLKNADFVDPNDKYMKIAFKIAENARTSLLDEANPFYMSEIVPVVNGFISDCANDKAPDIKSTLDSLQEKAENWSANLK